MSFEEGAVYRGRSDYYSSWGHRQVVGVDDSTNSVTYVALDLNREGVKRTISQASFQKWQHHTVDQSKWKDGWLEHMQGVEGTSNEKQPVFNSKVALTGKMPEILGWNDLKPGDAVRSNNGTFIIVEAPSGRLAVNLQTFTAEPQPGPFIRVKCNISIK